MCVCVCVCVLCVCAFVCACLRFSDLPQVSHIQASAHGGVIQVSWHAPHQNVSGYIVDWTDDGKTYFWKRSNHTETKLYGGLKRRQ